MAPQVTRERFSISEVADSLQASRGPMPTWPVWLAGYTILMCGLYFVWAYNLFDQYEALLDLAKMSTNTGVAFAAWIIVQTIMLGAWIFAIMALRGRYIGEVWLPVIGVTVLIYSAFVFVYPATAIDVYIYAARSHLLTDYGLNPSTVTPESLWDVDRFVHYASAEWSTHVSPYGPLWNIIAAPATAFGDDHILASLLIFKGITVAAAVGIGVLIHRITSQLRPGFAVAATVAWLWCPIVLWEGIANSHNDVILLLPVLAALWCWYRRYFGWVVPLLVVSALIKVVTLMFLPVAVVAILRMVGVNRTLIPIAAQSILLSIGVAWIAFAPFYDIRGAIDAVQSQRGVWVTSPALLLDRLSASQAWSLDLRDWYADFSAALLLLLTLVGTIVAWKRPDLLPRIAFEQFFWFLLLGTANLRPWYGIWLIAIVAILPLGFPWLRTTAWVIGGLGSYAFFSWVQHWFEMDRLTRDAINLTITLGPVLAVLVWWAIDAAKSRRAGERATIFP